MYSKKIVTLKAAEVVIMELSDLKFLTLITDLPKFVYYPEVIVVAERVASTL